MRLIIHRGSHEIGGTCIELIAKNSRILIDAGLPLPSADSNVSQEKIPHTLKQSLAQTNPPLKGILISHPHQDHYGLLESLPSSIPVYAGRACAALMKFTIGLNRNRSHWQASHTFAPEKVFQIGDFTIKPYLMDHSGFDSYAFLIKAEGKGIFYSGDFRGHGRKWKLTERLIQQPPPPVDLLLLEGTVVGSERKEETLSEKQLESKFINSFKNTAGAVFLTMSSQNIDRIVTVFRACKRSGRRMIIDPYTSEILEILKEFYITLPHPSLPEIKVSYPQQLCRWLERNGQKDLLGRHLQYGGKWSYFSENASKIVMLIRQSATTEVLNKKYFDLSKSKWIYSMWDKYLQRDKKLAALAANFKDRGTSFEFLHTSGHADMSTLKKFANNIKYKVLIPVHTSAPAEYKVLFKDVMVASDGEVINV